jgi:hypothetical protein
MDSPALGLESDRPGFLLKWPVPLTSLPWVWGNWALGRADVTSSLDYRVLQNELGIARNIRRLHAENQPIRPRILRPGIFTDLTSTISLLAAPSKHFDKNQGD